ncbi:Aste57867_6157 [Aphanomyces stellatus]|uniref:Aste57867_6157 protein n=1 Tax=Aphanomyces stellatus TaxID=120398 RepID=A0A485KH43_9STRA|nr:hypothetical protein As57867_006143 [Aphanomyces stellatus]VFT83162.1 Aste57867_6157 [Aphanomyces stellatus]
MAIGLGGFAVAINFIAMACAFTALWIPLWVSNTGTYLATDRNIQVGIWNLCVVQTRPDIKKHCFAYYTSQGQLDDYNSPHSPLRADSMTSVCSNYASDDKRTVDALTNESGVHPESMHAFLAKTCSSSGHATFALAICTVICLFLSCAALVVGIYLCRTMLVVVHVARFLTILAGLFSTVLSFVAFTHISELRYGPDGKFDLSVYLEGISFVATIVLSWAIEQYLVHSGKHRTD